MPPNWVLGFIAFTLSTQCIFILGVGNKAFCRPQRKRRLVLPVLISSGMMAVLVVSFVVAMLELINLDGYHGSTVEILFWVFCGGNWVGWFLVFFLHAHKHPRLAVFRRITRFLLVGSLAELLGSIPAHLIVSRRPGCLVGLMTMMAVTAGIGVMVWSFGPGIALLFFLETSRNRYPKNKTVKP